MALTEDLERRVSVLADATTNNTSKIEVNKADFEKQIQQIDYRLMALEVSVKQGFEQNDRRFEQVDQTIKEMGTNLAGLSVEVARVAAEVSRISTHLGVSGGRRQVSGEDRRR